MLLCKTPKRATSPCNIVLQWILIPPTLTSYPAAALLTFGDPYLSGHTPSGPGEEGAVISTPSMTLAPGRMHAQSCFMKKKKKKRNMYCMCAYTYSYFCTKICYIPMHVCAHLCNCRRVWVVVWVTQPWPAFVRSWDSQSNGRSSRWTDGYLINKLVLWSWMKLSEQKNTAIWWLQ